MQTQMAFSDAGVDAIVGCLGRSEEQPPKESRVVAPAQSGAKRRDFVGVSIGLLMSNTRPLGSDQSRNAAVRHSEQQLNPGGICVSRAALDQMRDIYYGFPTRRAAR
jgi:hypothetical protein